MKVVQVHLKDEQIKWADQYAAKLSEELKLHVTRADIIRYGLDLLKLKAEQEETDHDHE